MTDTLAIICVTNDLSTDQRVDKVARSLLSMGYQVLLVGRRKSDSKALLPRQYETHRFLLLFEKGPFFYSEYNLRLFFYLLGKKAAVFVANDLDTLLSVYSAARLTRTPVVYDSHEYFTEVPEIQDRPWVKKTWTRIEQSIFPRLKYIFTVNQSIADIYQQKYGKKVNVLRNVPENRKLPAPLSRCELGLPEDDNVVILQGAGINMDRGAEEAVSAMKHIEKCLLLIIGGGDMIPALKKQVEEEGLQHKVQFIPRQPWERLMQYTRVADLGLTLDKDTNLNYRYSLPNKLFDYIQAGIPILVSPLPEIKKIIEKYDIGLMIENHRPEHIAERIIFMLSDKNQQHKWRENLKLASSELCWEKEEKIVLDVYQDFI
jgi:glycosyltransferase involved in cell wall biosynthesis